MLVNSNDNHRVEITIGLSKLCTCENNTKA